MTNKEKCAECQFDQSNTYGHSRACSKYVENKEYTPWYKVCPCKQFISDGFCEHVPSPQNKYNRSRSITSRKIEEALWESEAEQRVSKIEQIRCEEMITEARKHFLDLGFAELEKAERKGREKAIREIVEMVRVWDDSDIIAEEGVWIKKKALLQVLQANKK